MSFRTIYGYRYQTNLSSATDTLVEVKSGITEDPDPVMESRASVDSPTSPTSPTAARELVTHLQSLPKYANGNFTVEQVGDFRHHAQRSHRLLWRNNVSRRDCKQAKKEFSTC